MNSLLNSWRVNRFIVATAAAFLFIATIGFLTYRRPSSLIFATNHWNATDPTLRVFFDINKPLPVKSDRFRLFGARQWDLGEPARWREPLGEDLCIIDLDNRPFSKVGEIWGPEAMTWVKAGSVHGISLGFLNHWVYAKIHGYKYYYVEINEYPDRRNSWKKAPVMSRILKDHKVCIFIDSDATFPNLNLPFEWLLNYWRFHPNKQSLALAFDPEADKNLDNLGKVYLNTGFVISQNLPRTYEILEAWEKCPEEGGTHPNCTEFRTNTPGFPTDQGGFGSYIRYEFDKLSDIMELPCTEGNGFRESNSGCDGIFISHWWTGKNSWIKEAVGRQMPGPFLPLLHGEFLYEKPSFFITEKDLMDKPVAGLELESGLARPANRTSSPGSDKYYPVAHQDEFEVVK